MEIEILNFEKYNYRTDCKTYWFRLQNEFYKDEKFYKISPDCGFLYVKILGYARQNGNPIIYSYDDWLILRLEETKKGFSEKLEELQKRSLIIIRSSASRARNADVTLHNITEHNSTARTDTESFILKMEALYNLYPKKEGKKSGFKTLRSQLKTEDDWDRFSLAIKNYISISKKTEPRYIKHFSTFANNWEDYVALETKEAQASYGVFT